MAKANKVPAKTETKVVVLEPAKITLELTEDEAYAIALFCGAQTDVEYGGPAETKAIYNALGRVGIHSYGADQPWTFKDNRSGVDIKRKVES